MDKRIIRKVGTLLLSASMIAGMVTLPSKAATADYLAEQAIASAPSVTAYLTGAEMDEGAEVTGTIDSINLSQDGSIQTFADSGEGIKYTILLDNSADVDDDQFEEVKEELKNLRSSLGSKDKMSLFTVGADSGDGEKTDVFGRLVKGSETDQVDADCEMIDDLELMDDGSVSVLYNAVNYIVDKMKTQSTRTIFLLITDGEDSSSNDTEEDTLASVQNAYVPVYGILLNNDATSPDEEKIDYTKNTLLDEKNSRGYCFDCTEGSVADAFSEMNDVVYDQTYVVNLLADTDEEVGKSELQMTVDNTELSPVYVEFGEGTTQVTGSTDDSSAPELDGAVQAKDVNQITFTLTDESGINESDAGDKSHYTLQSVSDDAAEIWTIDTVDVQTDGTSSEITLTTNKDLTEGDYTLKIKGIRDNSDAENKISDTADFTFSSDAIGTEDTTSSGSSTRTMMMIALAVLVLIVIAVILFFVLRRRRADAEENPYAYRDRESIAERMPKPGKEQVVQKPAEDTIRLLVSDAEGNKKKYRKIAEGSIFAGKADICDIVLKDSKLEPQHMAIEFTQDGYYVIDLETTNGTYLNGKKVVGRAEIHDGDILTAGRTKIKIVVPEDNEFYWEMNPKES